MDRVKLPDGVTCEGHNVYYDDRQFTDKTNTENIQQEFILASKNHKKKRSAGGKIFLKERKPSKLQRVFETIIYDRERITEMEKESYCDQFRNTLKERYTIAPLAELSVVSFGASTQLVDLVGLVDIITSNSGGQIRGISKINSNSVSHHLSHFWLKNKLTILFVERVGDRKHLYKIHDMGLRIGPELLNKTRNIVIPDSFAELRSKMRVISSLAVKKGICEDEFNDFIKQRFDDLRLSNTTEYQDNVPGDLPEQPLIVNDDQHTTQNEINKVENRKLESRELEFNIKIGFLPIVGTVKIK